ncbi:AbfB domain-containing protein [Actinoplanes sp. NPDC051851]|uniref:AbfB domain-containing protein n=1 Tax=Actinoplanes sp. NPDC051851 TaxID=3154753 RepID=UPI003442A630
MPEHDPRNGLRVGGWVPPYSPEARGTPPPIRPTTPISFSSFDVRVRRLAQDSPFRRRAALVGVALATCAVAALAAASIDAEQPGGPQFVAEESTTLPVPPPVAQSTVVLRSGSPSASITGSAPSSTPAARYSTSSPWPVKEAVAGTTKPSAAATTTTSKAADVHLTVGSTVGLTVADDSGYRIRHRNYYGRIDAIGASSTALEKADSGFTVRTGLANSSCVSLESVNYPGYFLRHQDYQIKLVRRDSSDLYEQDATFCPVSIRSGAALVLRSSNYPLRYVVESGQQLYLKETSAADALALVPRAAL